MQEQSPAFIGHRILVWEEAASSVRGVTLWTWCDFWWGIRSSTRVSRRSEVPDAPFLMTRLRLLSRLATDPGAQSTTSQMATGRSLRNESRFSAPAGFFSSRTLGVCVGTAGPDSQG